MTNNMSNKDAAANLDKAEHSQAANSPGRNRNTEEEAIASPPPRGSGLETGGTSAGSGPTRPAGTEVGAPPTAVTLTGGAPPSTPVRIGGRGTAVADSIVAPVRIGGSVTSVADSIVAPVRIGGSGTAVADSIVAPVRIGGSVTAVGTAVADSIVAPLRIGGSGTAVADSIVAPVRIGGSVTAVGTAVADSIVAPVRIGGSGTAVADSIVAATGVTGEGSSSRKRSGKGEEVSPLVPKKAKGEMDINPVAEPTCSTCGRTFASWKAVFGHMRAHPDRGWRGAFPPPEWSPEKPGDQQGDHSALRGQLAPRLLNLAIETLNKMKQKQGHQAGPSGPSARGRDFDLNAEPPREPESNSGSSSSPSDDESRFDLNKPPKPDRNNGNEGSSK
ncbi:hypothetical protein DKX38_007601 [Salix brachista]|uniref:C2H2-type domain-containing protein n=1 Tax=Salix brachista TaxID=2182728 RepID=A0A5N5MNR0_9ROSI|nr:hypothetical protein DKX38_007601 [Salix brachista]